MALAPSVRRGLTVLIAAALSLSAAPLLGSAAAAAPVVARTTPADGSRVQPTKEVSAMYDVPLDTTSRISVRDSANGTPVGAASVALNTITYRTTELLRDGAYRVAVDAVNALDKTATRTTFSFVVDGTAPVGTTVGLPAVTGANAAAVPVSGFAEPGSTVTLDARNNGGTLPQPAALPVTKKVSVPATGAYATTMDLSGLADGEGAVTVTAKAADEAGNVEAKPASATVSKDTTAPSGTTVSVDTDPVNTANKSAVTVTGRAEVGSAVRVVVSSDGGPATAAGEVLVTEAEGYALTLDLTGVADGELTATATATDAAGNASKGVVDTAAKDTVAPAVTVSPPPVISRANVAKVVVSGTAEPSLPVTLTLGSLPSVDAQADDKGSYTTTFTNAGELPEGGVVVTATSADAAGNSATRAAASFKDTEGPVDTTMTQLPAFVRDAMTISGSAEPRSSVTISVDDVEGLPKLPSATVTVTAKADALGAYRVDANVGALHDGALTVVAVATDAFGNTGDAAPSRTTTKDTTAPAAPGVQPVAVVNRANVADVVVSGTRDAGTSVRVMVADNANRSLAVDLAAGDSGTWSTTVDLTGLGDGALTVTATATDAAGNTSSRTVTTRKDTVDPAKPVIRLIVVANGANQAALPVSGTGEPGTKVQVRLSDVADTSRSDTFTVGTDGTWSGSMDVTTFAQGAVVGTATSTDDAGNTSAMSDGVTTRKDTAAPPAPTGIDLAVVNAANVRAYWFTGTSEPASTVSVSVDDAGLTGRLTDPVTATATAADGAFSVGPLDLSALDEGTLTVTVTATDLALNTGAPAKPTVLKDTEAPGAPVITTATDPVVRSNVDAATVSGTADEGSVVTVSADDAAASTSAVTATSGTVPSNGAYSATLDLRSLVDGALTYVASARDAAGNTSVARSKAAGRNVTALALVTSTPGDAATVRTVPEVALVFAEPIARDASSMTLRNRLGTALAGATSFRDADSTLVFTPLDTLTETGSPYVVEYRAVEARAPQSDTVTATLAFSVDPNRQNPPVITVTDPVTAANAAEAVVAGTADLAGSRIDVSVDDGDSATPPITGTGNADADRAFTVPVDLSSLRDGVLTATATATENGVTSSPGTATADKDATAPAGTTVSLPSTITQANQRAVTVTGAAEPGSSVDAGLTGGTKTLVGAPTRADEEGRYAVTFDATTLPDGGVTVRVIATDAVGNAAAAVEQGADKDTAGPTIAPVTVTNPVTKANQAGVVVSGRTESGRPVDVTITDGTTQVVAPTVTGAPLDGAFSVTMDVASLADDRELTVRAVSSDSHGNARTSSGTTYKDAAGPLGTALVLPAVNAANAANVTATGTGEPGARIALTVSDAEAVTDALKTADVTGSATVGTDGAWVIPSLDLSGLREGVLTAAATVEDDFGNAGEPVTVQVVKDTVAPVITGVAVPQFVNSANAAGMAVGGSATGDASQVTVSVDDADASAPAVTTTTAMGNGAFDAVLDVRALADTAADALVTTVVARDRNGNAVRATRTSTKDTQAPVINGLTATGTNATRTSTTVSGATERLAALRVAVSDGSAASTATGAADSTGGFSVSVDASRLADGTVTVTAAGTDVAGNLGAPADVATTKDALTPSLTTVGLPTVALANRTAVPVAGAADPGSVLRLTVVDVEPVSEGGVPAPTADVTTTTTAGPDGRYTVPLDLSALHDGNVTATATETDTAGNTGGPVTATAVKDTVAPKGTTGTLPSVVTPADQRAVAVNGAAEPGARVAMSVDDTDATSTPAAQRVTAATDGSYRAVLDLGGLVDGALTGTVTATDGAGNGGEAVQLTTVKDTTGPAVTALQFTGPVTAANAETAQASGRTEPGAGVTVTVTDAAGHAASGAGAAGSDGGFVLPVSVASLADGVLTVSVRGTDTHGNAGGPATTTVQKDTAAAQEPTAPPTQEPTAPPTQEPTAPPTQEPTPTETAEPLVAPAPPRADGATRFAGADRYTTAAAVSRGSFPGTANDVFIVTGTNWPDALSAGPAAASVDAPVLPVQTGAIPTAIRDEVLRLKPRRAWIIGGAGVVKEDVVAELRARGITVTRISGKDRYATAAAVAARFFPDAAGAYYASGAGYADALGGGAAAAHRGWPLLLTAPTSVPAATPVVGSQRVVLGGPSAVSEAVRSQLGARRVAGGDRYATAAAIARDGFAGARVAYVATGLNFPDALAGAPAAFRDDAPLLLAAKTCVTAATRDAARALGSTSRVVLGGKAVISDEAAALIVC